MCMNDYDVIACDCYSTQEQITFEQEKEYCAECIGDCQYPATSLLARCKRNLLFINKE